LKVEYINPFVLSVIEVFETMLSAQAKRGAIGLYDGDPAKLRNQVTALIGLSGHISGTVAMGFSMDMARQAVGRLLDQGESVEDALITDGVAELVNMIAGGAKARLTAAQDKPIDLGLPSVVRGEDFTVTYPRDAKWLEIPFETSLGEMILRVTFRDGPAR
jgi:CheY-specific phosphatase CheX